MPQVKPGAKAPADGEVEEGASHVDESMISGESVPVSKRRGSPIISGGRCCWKTGEIVSVTPTPKTAAASAPLHVCMQSANTLALTGRSTL